MLKVALVLGCLLSLTVAQPMEHQRFARSSGSGSNSNERRGVGSVLTNSLFQALINKWLSQLTSATTTTAPTTTTTTPTTTTTTPTTTTTTPTTTTTTPTTTTVPTTTTTPKAAT
ncbi:integumentary mucin C.1 [Austrofundulus limnaeus]|uniref:Integumentary mucin C.1 n=1 Tax=Austrofundulus limnaeus TaxID=52670 RepID=A0A2I4B6C3_AUSLI|nr:PREDICTED: integumentary mucin C.1-like [Austrofundulus limnaeus]